MSLSSIVTIDTESIVTYDHESKKGGGVPVRILGSQVLTSGLSQQVGGHLFIKESIYGLLLQCEGGPHPVRMSCAHGTGSHDVHDFLVSLSLRHERAADRLRYSGGVKGYDAITTGCDRS